MCGRQIPEDPKLSRMADDAITLGGIGSLVSPLYICGYMSNIQGILRPCLKLCWCFLLAHIRISCPGTQPWEEKWHHYSNWFTPFVTDVSSGGFRGGRRRRAPPPFFAEIEGLTLCRCLRQKECTKLCELTLKITFFLRGHIPLRHSLSTQVPKFCQSFNLGAPSFKKSWIRPWY